MKTKKYLILISMVVWAAVLFAAQRSDTSQLEKLQRRLFGASTLQGAKSVYPQVILEVIRKGENEPSLIPRISPLSRKDLQTQVDELLRKSRIEIAESVDDPRLPDAPLSLNVTVFVKVAGEDNLPIYAAFVNTEVLQPVKLLRNKKVGTLARTWPMIPVGVETQCLLVLDSQTIRQKIRDEVIRQVNRFINDYLAANPKLSSLPTEQTREDIVVPPKEIVVSPIGSWRPSGGWGSVDRRYTRNARIDTTTGHPRFVVEDANSLHVWLRSDVRVPISKYPIAVLKYRTENIGQDWYCIWMDDGTGPYNGCEVFELADLTADGKTHECRFDLRKERLVHTGRTKKLNENGIIRGMALGVKSGEATPAYVEIIDLRFLPAGRAGIPVPKDEKARKKTVVTPKEIVIPPIGPWKPAGGWGSDLYRSTRNARIKKTDGHLEFIVEDANSLHVWRRYGLRVPISDYPIAVFTYRARNVAPGWYTIWMDDGAGPWGGCTVFRPNKLIVDGKMHEIRADLRKVREVHKNSIKQLNVNGSVVGMALGVRAGKNTPAVLEFIDLRFLPEK